MSNIGHGITIIDLSDMSHHRKYRIRHRHVPAIAVGGGFAFEPLIFKGLTLGAPYVKLIGLYTYYERLAQGLRQLMAGCRTFSPASRPIRNGGLALMLSPMS